MVLPVIKVQVEAETDRARAGLEGVERSINDVGAASDRVAARSSRLDRSLDRTARSSGAFRSSIQNASFQVADLATQLELGVDPARAFAQQGSQLLGAFGPLGAALGAVVSIAVPLAAAFKGASDSGKELTSVFGTLEPLAQSISNAFANVVPIVTSFAETVINNIDRIIITAGVAASLFAGRWVAGFVAARLATFTLTGALVALRGALIRTGIGALVVAAGELVFQFTRLAQGAGGFSEALSLVGDVAREVFDRVGIAAQIAGLRFETVWLRLRANALAAFSAVLAKITGFANDMISKLSGAAAVVGSVFRQLPAAIGSAIVGVINTVISGIDSLIGKAVQGINTVISGVNNIPGIVVPTIEFGGLGRVGNPFEAQGETMGEAFARGASGAFQVPSTSFDDSISGLRGRAAGAEGAANALGLDLTAPLESVQKIRDTLASIKEDRITLPDLLGLGGGDEEGGGGSAKKKLDEELTAQEKRIKEHFDRIRALTQGGLSDKLGAWGNYFTNLVSLTGSSNQRLLALGKSFAAAQALIDAWSAHNKVLADPTLPWWARAASAANVLAAGIGAVNAIRGVSAGGGGSASAGGGGGSASASTSSQASGASDGPLDVRLASIDPNAVFSGGSLQVLFDRLQDEAGDRGVRFLGNPVQ